MKTPEITVLMPVYNTEKYLREAIDSILNQTFTDFEFLIINDGSTDSSEEIILSYNDPRIRYVKNENNTRLIATLNRGIGLVQTKYMVRADADDINTPDRLQTQFDFMEKHPDIALCGSWFESFSGSDIHGTVKYAPDNDTICIKQLYQIHLSHGTSIFRMSVLKENNLLFNPDFSHAEDYELWSRIGEVGRFANIQMVLYRVREHGDKVSVNYSNIQAANSLRVRALNFKNIGVELSDEELTLYQQIAQHEYQKNSAFLLESKKLLEKIAMNAKDSFSLSREVIRSHVAGLWFNVAYNLTSIGPEALSVYVKSDLKEYYPSSLSFKIKFLVKAVLHK